LLRAPQSELVVPGFDVDLTPKVSQGVADFC
jgi:hypothetical protein